jgi:hypothetical protein
MPSRTQGSATKRTFAMSKMHGFACITVVHSENLICDIDSHGFLESGRLVSDDLAF